MIPDTMKLGFVQCVFLAVGMAVGQSPATATFSIAISTPATTVRLGEPIPLKIIMTNTSRHDIHWGQLLSEKRVNFGISVVDAETHAVALTAYGRQMNGIPEGGGIAMGGSTFPVTLAPGKSITEELLLNREYEINHAGIYRIEAERYVKSNVIVLTVK
jgi:hypothetical protein